MKTIERDEFHVMTPREIFGALDRFVIGQTHAKRSIAVAAYNHLKRITERGRVGPGHERLLRKANMLLIGPTGCGKTHIARNLAAILDLPFVVVDATEYTEAGYYGKDVEVMVAELLFRTQQNVEATERGIIFVDEIDKIARRGHGERTGAGSRDIGGEGVQQSLLKLLEGREIFVPLNVTQHWSKHDFVQVDTTDILFICAGTFSDLHANRDAEGKTIGFGDEKRGGSGDDASGAIARRRIEQKALIDYGLLAEFLGRLPVVVELGALSERELEQVITVPPDSLLKEYQQLLALDDVKLTVKPDAVRAIAAHAAKRRTGARGLRAIFEDLMHDFLFDAPERRGETIEIDESVVANRLSQNR